LLPEAGISPEVTQYIGLTRWDIPPQTLSLPGVQGGWFAVPDPAAAGSFSSQYQTAYGSAPHPIAGLAFDGIAAVGALVSQGKSNALTAGALTQGAGYRGASGVFRLRSDGSNERGLAVATIRNNQVLIVSPAPQIQFRRHRPSGNPRGAFSCRPEARTVPRQAANRCEDCRTGPGRLVILDDPVHRSSAFDRVGISPDGFQSRLRQGRDQSSTTSPPSLKLITWSDCVPSRVEPAISISARTSEPFRL
jgi:hypothetical protein